MIIHISNSSSYIWLSVYFYKEPLSLKLLISIFELSSCILCGYILNLSIFVMLKIQLFHKNLMFLTVPLFAIWHELIIGKFITIAYRLKIVNPGFELGEHTVFWTNDPDKTLEVAGSSGLELLIFGGFLQWHTIYSIVFGILAVATERTIASVYIKDYESKERIYIPIILTIISQLLSISISLAIITQSIGPFLARLPFVICAPLSVLVFLFIKHTNQSLLKEICNPKRTRIFTVSQQCQVKENLRALRLGTRLVVVVIFYISICGFGIAALTFGLIPAGFGHLIENFLFLHPYPICLTAMFSIPQWRDQFKKSILPFLNRRLAKIEQVVTVRIEVNVQNSSSVETDIYFRQLTESWT
ncbi:Serpentine receptor class epsilon-30 [Caenorhabditis elegans]|uniref:Serpentine receptor class epsilon-30 n=1 Tax=Caenorhabditis elegans TaxID=6239 RepID=SRE30_CAEEL|nr:Serpentine receptor class epsilon-30 [Caenorhabditis elegans]O62267.1 RecName: Full=Serpentine receptor class epsilon-30; Short=Protein sre-30 [Caenorhabditis elegans]CAB05750.1 Serpentine receptor class epsilon-30 [Caenorhabditis elegans]|eukprot:NP_496632.1 Serpentine receptor class epsilon-30 [Caenorhabditis elegans]